MTVKAIADNATKTFTGFVKSRSPDPDYDPETQTLVHLPEPPDFDTQRWDDSKGVQYKTDKSGDVVRSSVPIRGLNAAEQAELQAAQTKAAKIAQVEKSLPVGQLMESLADLAEVLDDLVGLQLLKLDKAKREKWQRAQQHLAKVRQAMR